nr:RNA-directed DNA polymerase, eukaryota, reverse transcriptase zinc-binding domain protein [Tanacetum cinerariifolium]
LTEKLAQKAKIKWSVEGDENSQFFHGMLNKRRNQMNIRGIMVDGTWIEKPDQVKGEFIKHFRNRFDKPLDNLITIDMCFPKSLTTQQQEELESNVSKEELKRAVWDCGVDKSPGPDGFSFGFYRHFWSTIENDVLEAVNHFLTHGDIPKGCNSSFIILIPKVLNANIVKDFRPISLIESIYKIIAKILANRLVNMLDDIVNEVQCAFIAERQILDGPFIINEVMQWCNTKKKQAVIFKVDFEKAYDSVRWDFLDERVVEAGMFKGIELSSSLNISHLFFEDDAMFVGRWCDGNIDTLMNVLECFHLASGLRINMSKSKIMGVHVEDSKVKHGASKLGCLILNTPFSYLGTKIGGVMSRAEAWKEVVDKVTSRLSKWKMKSLSIWGMLTLLKSVFGSIPIYHMSIYRVPKRVLLGLESIHSHFFNGHDSNSKKASWVKWSSVITSKEKGCLSVASLYALNRALMLKWVACSGTHSCWMNIVNEVNVLKEQGINLFEFMKRKMGDGANTCFWEDNCAEGGILKNKFPRVYALEKNKKVLVSVKMKDPGLDHSLRRKVRGGAEQSQLNALSELLDKVNLVPQADRHIWSLDSSEVFSVASMRKLLDDHRSSLVSSTTRWVKYVPIKVNVFAWKVKMNALPTRFNISRRGIDIESIICPLCDSGAESSNHLFFNCTVARHIFSKIVRWWDIVYKEVNSYAEWLSWLLSLRLASKLKMMLECVFYVMWWYIWTFRNKFLFDKNLLVKALIFDEIVSISFNWCRFRCKASFSWDAWLKNPCLIVL